MRQSGFNVVRLAIAWSLLEPVRGEIDTDYLERVAHMVDLLNRRGLYVVLDMHVTLGWGPRFGGAGAPWWAAHSAVPHFAVGYAGDWTDAVSPAVLASNAYFWVSPDWQADLLLVWRAVATRFRDVSGVAGYDLFNEPNSAPLPPHVFEEKWMWPFYSQLIQNVGLVDPNHAFLVEAPLILQPITDQVAPHILPLAAPNLIYSPHVYVGSIVAPLYPDDPDRIKRQIRIQAGQAARLPATLWWGELGVDTGKPFAADWTDAALDTLDELQVGWAWWQWRQDWGWGVRNHAGDFFNEDFLRRLARPFVAAAPPGVHGERGNGVTGQLTLAIASDHADLPVIVSWPAATLGDPLVQGTCVQTSNWRKAEAHLSLELKPGAGCSVRVSAAE
jgi:endoglycosylceramidase